MEDEERQQLLEYWSSEDYDAAGEVIYKHLLRHHHDCTWCPLKTFPVDPECTYELLLYKQREEGKEDRYDFTIDSTAVRLRRGYSRKPEGVVGRVWAQRVYEYCAFQGSEHEEIGVPLSEIEAEITRPMQLHASVTLQDVIEKDARFETQFHYPSEQPACVSRMTLSDGGEIYLGRVRVTGASRPLKEVTSLVRPPSVSHQVGVCAGQPPHQAEARVGRRYKHVVSLHVFIRENPLYSMQFRGVVNSRDGRSPGVCGAAVVIYKQRQPTSTLAELFNYSSFIGRHADVDYGAFVALNQGLARCLELGYTPLLISSDCSRVLEHLSSPGGFVRTVDNYLQAPLAAQAAGAIKKLGEDYEQHQEALLAASPALPLDKARMRRERPPALSFLSLPSNALDARILQLSAASVAKGESLCRGWGGRLYSEDRDSISFLKRDCLTDRQIPGVAEKPLGMAVSTATTTLSLIFRDSEDLERERRRGRKRC